MIRIGGLVSLASGVRRELNSGAIPVSRRDALSAKVNRSLAEVREILARHGATVRRLPAPSQRAIRYLASIDWSTPTPAEDAPTRPREMPRPVSWPGLGGFVVAALDALALDMTDDALELLNQRIARQSRQMELSIARRRLGPDRLSPATRDLRAWIAYFSHADRLSAYRRARQSANALLDATASRSRRGMSSIRIRFGPVAGLYRLRRTPIGYLLALPTPMIVLGSSEWQALGAMVFHDDSVARQRLTMAMLAEPYQRLRVELEELGGMVDESAGVVHHLGRSFDRVNAAYFKSSLARPRLKWSRALTGRKFGHYDYILDVLMVSQTLDSRAVPEFVVDFLVFHEALHKHHGLYWVNGRGYAHTAEFRASERTFARYAEAEEILAKVARSMR